MLQCRLSYADTSRVDRPTLVMLHGFLGSGRDWDWGVQQLIDQQRCITIDLPGHGASANLPDECFPVERCAEAIIDLLDDLSLERVNLLGYSMGGRLALYLAVWFPERFSKVVLESASPGLKTEQERAERKQRDEQLADRLAGLPLIDFLAEWYSQPLFAAVRSNQKLYAELVALRAVGGPVTLAKSLRWMSTGRMPSLWDRLETLEIPLLCLAGEFDEKYSQIAREMASLAPYGEAAVIADAGHLLHFEQPADYIARVREFLSE